MPDEIFVSEVLIKVDNTLLELGDMDQLHEIEVDSSIHLPASATLSFYDRELKLVDSDKLNVGKTLEVSFLANAQTTPEVVFQGVIAAIEPEFSNNEAYGMFVVRAYDRSFWLHRGTKSATYVQMKDSDIVSKLCSEAGLSTEIAQTKSVHEHVYRHNISDFEFIKDLAARNGYVALVDGTKLRFKKPSDLGNPTVELEYGVDVLEFRPALTLAAQVNEVSARGWDRKTKKAVNGVAASANLKPTATGIAKRGSALAQAALGGKRTLNIGDTWNTQVDAEISANTVFDTISASDVTGEGIAIGNPKIRCGGNVKITKVGNRFSGTYLVTRVRHRLQQGLAYETDFWIGGMSSGTLASLVQHAPKVPGVQDHKQIGLLTGIVTNLNDPDQLGRVRVKFPSISEDEDSYWCPVISAGAGNGRGLMIIPEVNDEVIVAFEHGDINRPYILGGLWNGKDTPPEPAVVGGKNNLKLYKSTSGHILRFTDEAGKQKIELIDKTGSNLLSIDSVSGDITIKASGNLKLEATRDVTISGVNVKIDGKGSGAFTATAKLELKGAMVDVAGQGMTKISGATVMIN